MAGCFHSFCSGFIVIPGGFFYRKIQVIDTCIVTACGGNGIDNCADIFNISDFSNDLVCDLKADGLFLLFIVIPIFL